jgi:hypothetical protein
MYNNFQSEDMAEIFHAIVIIRLSITRGTTFYYYSDM